MPKVLFTQDRVVQDENRDNPEKRTEYKAGTVYEMEQASINRWVSRGVATTDEAKIAEVEEGTSRTQAKGDTVKGSQTEAGGTGSGGSGSPPAPDSSSQAEENVRNPEQTKAGEQAESKTEGDNKPTAMTSFEMPGTSSTRRGR
jgi:hypothetical protein